MATVNEQEISEIQREEHELCKEMTNSITRAAEALEMANRLAHQKTMYELGLISKENYKLLLKHCAKYGMGPAYTHNVEVFMNEDES